MKRNIQTLDSFFKPQQKKTNIHVENEDVPVKKILSKKSVASPQPLNAPGDNTSNIDKSIKDSEIYLDDISLFTNTSKSLTDEEKLKVLKHIWVPPNNFTFPVIENKKRKLKFQSSWMNLFPWLAYSKIRQGGYCKYCVAFAKYGGIGNQPLGQLVVNPFINYKDALQDFRAHSKKKYHIEAVLDAENFLDVFEKRKLPIIQQIDNDRVIQIQENRKRLVPIIQCILLCGREDISLRGHRDHGQIDISDDKCNEGNFRAILKYRAKGDDYLKTVLEGPGKRNKYISPGIQNQIIEACNKIILKKIVDKINMSECFSVLADETTDISTTEQLSICVRYVDSKNILNESFLQFFSIHSLTGKDLATSILRGLSDCGLNCEFMYGQGYDGASNMAGEFRGVQKIINDQFPRALYVHCSAHSLNLAVSSSSNIRPIRNCLGIVEKLHVFFNTPKRNNVLQNEIEKADHTPNVTTLKRLCATRWVQRYDALNDFCELYPYVVKSLSYITSEWKDTSATDACMLLKNIQDSEFMVSLYVTKVLFSYGLPICKQLQKEKIDLKKTIDLIENVISVLTDMREASEKEFKLIFNEVKKSADLFGITINKKRITTKQTNRANPQNIKSDEDYFRVTIFLPYIDHFISQLKERFINHKNILIGFECLFHSEFTDKDKTEFQKLVDLYSPIIDKHNVLAELKMWKLKLASSCENLTKNGLEALQNCDKDIYPNIHFLFKILVTLPVSTATPERSFSTLKRLKSYCRNSMNEERLNGLALLSVHRTIDININEVIDELATKQRKLDFVL